MSSSHLNRLQNEILMLKSKSNKFVPYEKYYIIHIQFPNIDIPRASIDKWGKECILDRNNQPLFVYVCYNEIYLFFSCLAEGEHFMKGGHQELCSMYSSMLTNKICQIADVSDDKYVFCNLIELETQSKVFTYVLWKNAQNSFRSLASHLKVPIEEVYKRTFEESLALIEATPWDDIPKSERYGTIYKLKKKKGRIILSSFSKRIDARKKEHYMTYFFG